MKVLATTKVKMVAPNTIFFSKADPKKGTQWVKACFTKDTIMQKPKKLNKTSVNTIFSPILKQILYGEVVARYGVL